jgi:hypothetical protein
MERRWRGDGEEMERRWRDGEMEIEVLLLRRQSLFPNWDLWDAFQKTHTECDFSDAVPPPFALSARPARTPSCFRPHACRFIRAPSPRPSPRIVLSRVRGSRRGGDTAAVMSHV